MVAAGSVLRRHIVTSVVSPAKKDSEEERRNERRSGYSLPRSATLSSKFDSAIAASNAAATGCEL